MTTSTLATPQTCIRWSVKADSSYSRIDKDKVTIINYGLCTYWVKTRSRLLEAWAPPAAEADDVIQEIDYSPGCSFRIHSQCDCLLWWWLFASTIVWWSWWCYSYFDDFSLVNRCSRRADCVSRIAPWRTKWKLPSVCGRSVDAVRTVLLLTVTYQGKERL